MKKKWRDPEFRMSVIEGTNTPENRARAKEHCIKNVGCPSENSKKGALARKKKKVHKRKNTYYGVVRENEL